MRLRHLKDDQEIINNSPYFIKEPLKLKGHFKELFGNDQPLQVEVGMGKGQFIIAKAQKYPQFNFIGIDKYDTVIARALLKIKDDLPNLRMMRLEAEQIDQVFDHELTTIYLNFSDPWPKNRQAKLRLTHPTFLKKYESLFVSKPSIIQKTDNAVFFAYSLKTFNNAGYHIDDLSVDLYHSSYLNDNLPTEYETKFQKEGKPIYYLKVSKK